MIELDLTAAPGAQRLEVSAVLSGGVTAVYGPSGAGKTTLLRAVAGLQRLDRGHIRVGGAVWSDVRARVHLPPQARRIGYVFQDARLFPHLDVRRNLTYGGALGLDEVVELLGLGDLLGRGVAGLSGGERQRVAMGRALLRRPDLLLLDEPLAGLDAARKAEVLPYLERLRDHAGLPMIYVSHDMDEVARMADDLLLLDAGRQCGHGALNEVLTDLALQRRFPGRTGGAVLRGTVAAHVAADGVTRVAIGAGDLILPGEIGLPGQVLRLRLPAQDIILARSVPEGISALNVLRAEVVAVGEPVAGQVPVLLRTGSERIVARVTARSIAALGLAPGQRVHAIVKATAVAV